MWRRLFPHVLNLIQAHALIHQATRDQDSDGTVSATLDDYEMVRTLLADLIGERLRVAVPPEVRRVVELVAEVLESTNRTYVSARGVAWRLNREAEQDGRERVDQSTVWRRIEKAIDLGYLRDIRDYRSPGMRLVVGERLPQPAETMPSAKRLRVCMEKAEGISR